MNLRYLNFAAMICSTIRFVGLGILLLTSAHHLKGGPKQNEVICDEIEFRSTRPPARVFGSQMGEWGSVMYSGPTITNKDDVTYFDGLSYSPSYLLSVLGQRPELDKTPPFLPLGSDLVFYLPPISHKEIVPLFGDFFQLTSGFGDGTTGVGGIVTFEKIPIRNRPADLTIQPDSIILYLQRMQRGMARFHDASVYVEDIHAIPESSPRAYSATIGFMFNELGVLKYKAEVKQGDILLIRDQGHLVRKIVPRDEKANILGWVELDIMPVSQAELVKKKVSFVQPEKIQK